MSDQQRPPRRRLVDPYAASPPPQDPRAAYPLPDQGGQGPARRQPRRRLHDPAPRDDRPRDGAGPQRRLQDPAPLPSRSDNPAPPRPYRDQAPATRAVPANPAPGLRPRPDTTPRPYDQRQEQAWSQAPQEQRGLDGVRPARPPRNSYERAGSINPAQVRPRPRSGPPPQPPQPVPPRAPSRRPRRLGRRIGAITVVLVLLIAGLGVLLDTRLQRTDALPDYAGRPGNTFGQIWLVVGSDSRQGLTTEQESTLATGGDLGVGRTDTIMLLHKPWFGAATLVSIPRDSYVAIPGYGSNKINAAFAFGGPQLLVQTVEQNTGLRIDHYVEVGFGGFAATVDAVGGVQICPAEAINDPLAGINLQAGCQDANGATALGYVRTRATAQGDLDRVARQREFMGSLIKASLSPTTLLNPFHLVPLVSSVTKSITVNKNDHIPSLATFAWSLRGNPASVTVPIGGRTTNATGAVLLWDETTAPQLFAAMKRNRPVPAELIGQLRQN